MSYVSRDSVYGAIAYLARPRVPTRQEIDALFKVLLVGMPDPNEIRDYINNGSVTGWSEDYPNAALWLTQFADLLDALSGAA